MGVAIAVLGKKSENVKALHRAVLGLQEVFFGLIKGLIWALPVGMLAVSRLLISVSIGEEDRQTLTDVMRVMFRRYLPLMCLICAVPKHPRSQCSDDPCLSAGIRNSI